jgi:hypothetical protein
MTTQQLLDYYVNLLILQYKGKPRAEATVEAVVNMVLMDQLPLEVENGFNLETCVGDQLDVLGKYIGAPRLTNTEDGPVNLSDADYRSLLRLVAIKNSSGSSLFEIVNLLGQYFPNIFRVTDSGIMQLNYLISTTIGSSELLSALVYGDFLPRPMGVSISITPIVPSPFPFFGFITYEVTDKNVSPFNTYENYEPNTPFLVYEDAVI